jgi:hypothetical protein
MLNFPSILIDFHQFSSIFINFRSFSPNFRSIFINFRSISLILYQFSLILYQFSLIFLLIFPQLKFGQCEVGRSLGCAITVKNGSEVMELPFAFKSRDFEPKTGPKTGKNGGNDAKSTQNGGKSTQNGSNSHQNGSNSQQNGSNSRNFDILPSGFSCEPRFGTIPPFGQVRIIVRFRPKQLGKFENVLKLVLGKVECVPIKVAGWGKFRVFGCFFGCFLTILGCF